MNKSASGNQKNRKKFGQGIFPEQLITPEMIQTFEFMIECAPNQPKVTDFKLTSGMLLLKVPAFMVPPLEYCDHLLELNEKTVTKRKEFYETLIQASQSKAMHFLKIKVRRVMSTEKITDESKLPSNASIRRPRSSNPMVKPAVGYSYYKTVLIYFPHSKLGINVKSYDNVVYVESTDNTWGSTTRRFLYVGDAILKIDNEEINDLQKTEKALKNGLVNEGIVTLIIERADGQLSANYVRSVLSFNKSYDPQLARDVINICKERYEYHKKNGFGPEPKPILRGKSATEVDSNTRVSISKKVVGLMIGCEQYNPATMMKVPNYQDPKSNNEKE